MLNSRCWSYDVGLALLVFSTSGDWDIVMEMLHRLKEDQNADVPGIAESAGGDAGVIIGADDAVQENVLAAYLWLR